MVFLELLELNMQGHEKGKITINPNAIIHIREESVSNGLQACRITTTQLSVDDILAVETNASASYSESMLVNCSLEQFSEMIRSINCGPKSA